MAEEDPIQGHVWFMGAIRQLKDGEVSDETLFQITTGSEWQTKDDSFCVFCDEPNLLTGTAYAIRLWEEPFEGVVLPIHAVWACPDHSTLAIDHLIKVVAELTRWMNSGKNFILTRDSEIWEPILSLFRNHYLSIRPEAVTKLDAQEKEERQMQIKVQTLENKEKAKLKKEAKRARKARKKEKNG